MIMGRQAKTSMMNSRPSSVVGAVPDYMLNTRQKMPPALSAVGPFGRTIQKYSSETGGIDVARNSDYAHHRFRTKLCASAGPSAEAWCSLGENRDERIKFTGSVSWQH